MRNTAGYSLTICRAAHMYCSAAVTKQVARYGPTPIYFSEVTQNLFPVLQKVSYRLWTCYWKMPSSMPSKIWFSCCNPIQVIQQGQAGPSYTQTWSVLSFLDASFSSWFSRQSGKAASEFSNPPPCIGCKPRCSSGLCRTPHTHNSGEQGSSLTAAVQSRVFLSHCQGATHTRNRLLWFCGCLRKTLESAWSVSHIAGSTIGCMYKIKVWREVFYPVGTQNAWEKRF